MRRVREVHDVHAERRPRDCLQQLLETVDPHGGWAPKVGGWVLLGSWVCLGYRVGKQ